MTKAEPAQGHLFLPERLELVGWGIYSFATLDDSARERAITLAPVVHADGGAGLALTVQF